MDIQLRSARERAAEAARLEAEAAKASKAKAPPAKKPPAGKAEPELPYEQALHEEEVRALIDTRVAFFGLYKGDGAEAVNEVRSIVGPEDPARWAEAPDCLRNRYDIEGEAGDEQKDAAAAASGSSKAARFNQLFVPFMPAAAREVNELFQMFEIRKFHVVLHVYIHFRLLYPDLLRCA